MSLHEAAFQVAPDKDARTEEGTELRILSAGGSIRSALPSDRQSVDGRMDRTRNESTCSSGVLDYIQPILGRNFQSQGRRVCLARCMDIPTCATISPPLSRRISQRVTKGGTHDVVPRYTHASRAISYEQRPLLHSGSFIPASAMTPRPTPTHKRLPPRPCERLFAPVSPFTVTGVVGVKSSCRK